MAQPKIVLDRRWRSTLRCVTWFCGRFSRFNCRRAPGLELNPAPEGDSRFPVDARLDGRTFLKFDVDRGVGDEVLEPLDRIAGQGRLAFAGMSTIAVPTLSTERHWAEKLRAYTLPRDGATNSRVKGLVDHVRLVERQPVSPERIPVSGKNP